MNVKWEDVKEDYARKDAEIEKLKEDVMALEMACTDLQKSYNKQHDHYKDIFISLVKVERELEESRNIDNYHNL